MSLLHRLRENPIGVRLFGLAFLTLYLELSLIRFASAHVLYLGYFSNFVLVAVFLGIGLGFLAEKKKLRLFPAVPVLVTLVVGFILIARIDMLDVARESEMLYFSSDRWDDQTLPLWLALSLLFGITALLFTCISQETARSFSTFKPLTAYSIDIGGSLAGIVFFTAHSAIGGAPLAWFGIGFLLMAILATSRINMAIIGVCGALTLGGLLLSEPEHERVWSPYQRIDIKIDELAELPDDDGNPSPIVRISANGASMQAVLLPAYLPPFYRFPHREVRELRGGAPYERALVIGAGSGNDVGMALLAGTGHVDAVEIDPEILNAGVRHHPLGVYQSERVTTHVTDGRAFMESSDGGYDLIIYALTDSLALVSSQSSIRLESYLFTEESFDQARGLLNEDGVLILYNNYRERWLVDRIALMLERVFGHPPVVMIGTTGGWDSAAFAIGPNLAGEALDLEPTEPSTDDWPFLYMKERTLPPIYLGVMGLFVLSALIGVALLGRKTLGGFRAGSPFFFMGAAFLLLETKNIVQFSLLFGATWLVNSLVFIAILTSVLLANWAVAKGLAKYKKTAFALLFGSLALTFALPLSQLLAIESVGVRYVVTSAVLFSPIFFANIVFAELFIDAEDSSSMFGWNILGTMVGGALEYTSLTLGYRYLTLVVALLYFICALAVWMLGRARRTG